MSCFAYVMTLMLSLYWCAWINALSVVAKVSIIQFDLVLLYFSIDAERVFLISGSFYVRCDTNIFCTNRSRLYLFSHYPHYIFPCNFGSYWTNHYFLFLYWHHCSMDCFIYWQLYDLCVRCTGGRGRRLQWGLHEWNLLSDCWFQINLFCSMHLSYFVVSFPGYTMRLWLVGTSLSILVGCRGHTIRQFASKLYRSVALLSCRVWLPCMR